MPGLTRSPSSRLLLAIPTALVALALATSAAFAAAPIGVGAGETGPHLAVGNGGVGYLTWAANDVLHYCRLDPGATSCSASQTFTAISGFEADEGNAPLVATGRVLILSDRFGTSGQEKLLYSSASSFTSHETVANPASTLTAAAYAPAGTVAASERIATVESGPVTGGGFFQASGTTAGEAASTRFDLTSGDDTVAEAVALQGSTFFTAYVDLEKTPREVFWSRYTGSGGSVASLNTAGNWSTAAPIGQGAENVALAGGPSGLYVAYDRPDGTVVLQKYNGVGWDAPVALTEAGVPNGWFALSEDSAGVLHFAWEDAGGALHYRYARDASNASFTSPQTLATGGGFRELQLGVEASGDGWVTWQDFNSSYPYSNEALPVAPGEPPAPVSNPISQPPPSVYGGPTKITTKPLGHGLQGSLGTPKKCVPGGDFFKAKVGVKRKGSRAHKIAYSIPMVKFFLGKKLIKTDKKKPFEALFATTDIAAGKTLEVSARISVDLHKGRRHSTVSKTLKATVKTCG